MSRRSLRQGARRRPAFVCSLAFALGVWACKSGSLVECALVLLVSSLVFYALADSGRFGLLALVMCTGLGALRFQISQEVWSANDLRLHRDSGGQVTFYGSTVGEPDVRPEATYLVLDADSVLYPDSLCARAGRVLARFKFDPGIGPDRRVVLSGRLLPPPECLNPGDFSWPDYFLQRNLCAVFEPARDSPVLASESSRRAWLSEVVAPLRRSLKKTLAAHLDGEEAALLLGLILGEKEALTPATVTAFQRTGTLHLLAVSGSNVGVVVSVIWGVLLFLRVMRPFRIVLAALAVILFCFLAHNEASVVRATTVALLVLGGMALCRRLDALNLWGCALWVLLAWDPVALFGLGFQLSFGATLGILLVAPLVPPGAGGSRWGAFGRLVATSVLVSTGAQAATLPMLAGAFNEVPLVTPLANLVCVPLAGIATTAGVLTVLLAPLGDAILRLSSATSWILLRLLLVAVHGFNRIGVPVASLPTPGVFEIALYTGVLCAATAFIRLPPTRRRILFGIACGGVIFLAWSCLAPSRGPQLVVLRRSDLSAVLRLTDGSVWLVSGESEGGLLQATRAAQELGWSAPQGLISLKASNEESSSTSRESRGCIELVDSGPIPSSGSTTIWCRARDSLPQMLAVAFKDAALVVCRVMPPVWPESTSGFQNVIWVTDDPYAVAVPKGSGCHTLVLTGRGELTPGSDSVQVLHTNLQGAVRVLWRDGTFQAEPSIR